jgi:solute carrier family 25 thiamine pyrophosphate transporter 19
MANGAQVEQLKHEGSPRQVAVAGAAAGVISRFVIAPLDVVKIRLQLQSSSRARQHGGKPVVKGTLGTFAHIIRKEGIRALWNGNIPASFLYPLYGTVQFTTYHTLNRLLASAPPTALTPFSDRSSTFISGAVAGATATTCTYPFDLLRTRLAAASSESATPTSRALRRAVQSLWAERLNNQTPTTNMVSNSYNAVRPFYRGLSAALLSIAPHMGLFFVGYETLKPLLPTTLPVGSGQAVAGTIASVAAKTLVFPLDTVRKRLQVQRNGGGSGAASVFPVHAGGIARTVREIVQHDGVLGLYRGLGIGLTKAAPAGAVTVWAFEMVMVVLKKIERLEDEVMSGER